jgi:hypothetical protein
MILSGLKFRADEGEDEILILVWVSIYARQPWTPKSLFPIEIE